jgi:hypothetical protein
VALTLLPVLSGLHIDLDLSGRAIGGSGAIKLLPVRGITGDLAAGKIGADGLMTAEGEAQLW